MTLDAHPQTPSPRHVRPPWQRRPVPFRFDDWAAI
mgnify:CR=1 FL=1